MSRTLLRCAIISTLATSLACGDVTRPDADLADAALVNLAISSVSVISVTEIPKAGQPFEVRVQSYGLDGCWVADRTVVDVTESGAVITPYNRSNAMQGTACTLAIVGIPHRIMLTFNTPGPKTLVVRARDFTTREPVRHEVTITVVP